MGDFLQELGGDEVQAVAPVETFDAFVETVQEVPAVVPPANGTPAADDDFFSSEAAAAAPAAPAAPMEADDPRIAWAAQNRVTLQQRAQAEAAKKVEVLASAKEYLDKVNKARDVQLEQRRKANRDAEAVSGVAEGAVPKGNTPWERVISVCNFNSEGLSKDPFKELSRYKTVLLAAKAANISVAS